ncbi:MAG: HAMP domain-containing protein [Bacteroidales bacterium]|nr:HAMP domain-containing protein [Bacteroidales bacterium]
MKILQKLNNISVVYKLSGIISLLVLFSMLFVGIFSYSSTKTAILNRTYEQLTSVRFEKTQRLKSYLENITADINLFATQLDHSGINEEINKINPQLLPISSEWFISLAEDELFTTKKLSSIIIAVDSNLYVVNPCDTTETICSLHYVVLQNRIDKARKDNTAFFVTDIYENYNFENVFYIFTKSYNNHYIGFEIPSSGINDIMLEDNPYNGLGESGEVYLAGSDGLMRSQSRFIKNSVLQIKVNNPVISNDGKQSSGKNAIKDYRGINVLSSYGTINWGNEIWYIFAEIDYEEAMIKVYAFRDSIIFLGIVGIILFSALIMLLTVTITRPISKLKNAAGEIASGNYQINLSVSNEDEIGNLTRSFNTMAAQIEEQNKRIEEQRMNRLSEMIDWQESERRRLSRELHDGIGQLLLSAKFRIGRLKADSEKDNLIINETSEILSQAVQDIRDISNDLMPSVLSEFGLIKAVKNLCIQIEKYHNIEIEFLADKIDFKKDRTSTYLYRIIQEGLSNIIKHSGAKKVKIILEEQKLGCMLEILDDGNGFEIVKMNEITGHGLRNISERVKLLKGSCDIKSNPSGTNIKIIIPKI